MEKSAAVPVIARGATLQIRSATDYVLWLLLAAGAGEMVLFRTLSRVGVHIPKHGLVLNVYDVLVDLGSFAFNVSTVTVFVAIALLTYTALRQTSADHALLAAVAPLIAAFAALSLVLDVVDEGDGMKLVYGLLCAGIMIVLGAQAFVDPEKPLRRRLVVALIVLAYLAAQYYALVNDGYRVLGLTEAPPLTKVALEAAELVVVVNAFLVFASWSSLGGGVRWRKAGPQVIVAGLLMALYVGAYFGENSSTAAILSLWTLGLTLYLPFPLYVLALGLYGAAVTASLTDARKDDRSRAWDAIALGLLPVAGLTLDLTYQHLVAIVVLLLLVAPRSVGSERAALAPLSS